LNKKVLVTGAGGFIGSHVVQILAERGDFVVGVDNLNGYYDPSHKRANLREIEESLPRASSFIFLEGDIRDGAFVQRLFAEYEIDAVVHLAAMAGVRASLRDPALYYDVNLNGTLVLLEAAAGRLSKPSTGKKRIVHNFVFASTSSVYGRTERIPFVESDPCTQPLAPYAASKRAAELLGYTYHHVYGVNFTVLRFFTVYGPRSRPDMLAYKVAESIFLRREVPLHNSGNMHRDWTYIDDAVSGVLAAVDQPLGYEIINIGRGEPVHLGKFVETFEEISGGKAIVVPAPMPDVDVPYTFADITKARQLLGYNPVVSVPEGIARFVHWFRRRVLTQMERREVYLAYHQRPAR